MSEFELADRVFPSGVITLTQQSAGMVKFTILEF